MYSVRSMTVYHQMVIKSRSLTVLMNSPGKVDINVHEEVPLHTVHVWHRLW